MMEPGRELDALVAEKAMGWTRSLSINTLYPPGLHPQQNIFGHELPAYSTDISAAWKVVEKLRDDHFSLEEDGTHWKAHFGPLWAGAETVPHTICLAALRSKGVEV